MYAFVVIVGALAWQVWLAGEPGSTLRPALAAPPLLATFASGAPPVHIHRVRLLGRLDVKGGKLSLFECSIEPPTGSEHTSSAVPSAADRALSITGGSVRLMRTALSGHLAGALQVDAATLNLIECSLRDNHAQTGGAMLVRGDSHVRVERSNFTNNSASLSGGALQVTRAMLATKPLTDRLTSYQRFPCTGRRRACEAAQSHPL